MRRKGHSRKMGSGRYLVGTGETARPAAGSYCQTGTGILPFARRLGHSNQPPRIEGGEKKNPAGFSLSRMSSSLFGLVLISMEATQPVLSIFWRSRHDSNMRPTV
jgi:hypothetical protein